VYKKTSRVKQAAIIDHVKRENGQIISAGEKFFSEQVSRNRSERDAVREEE